MTHRRLRRGYTLVELMMSLAVFAAGVTGIIGMQRASAAANRHARNVTVANGIAQAWLDQLTVDASVWRTDLNNTVWLQSLNNAGTDGAWQLPAQSLPAARNFGPTFNVFGAPVAGATDFCVHIRLTSLYPGGLAGTGSIRMDVRVFWLRDGGTRVAGDCANAALATVAAVGTDANDDYFSVYQTGAVVQHP
ncbi:MAG TPA: prepilin-type N-terminal cleavage/methylation domain-containing protein [Polyangiaceae bacterium]|nr:prepilin-type N-terminal cleavage/methylation domain-containing protein [Polyangiaceae bacterium]